MDWQTHSVEAGKFAALFSAIAGAAAVFVRLMRTPIVATHRYYGKLAWAEEMEASRQVRLAVGRMEPEVEILRRDVSEIKDKIDTIFGVLLDRGVPGGDYNPPSRSSARDHSR